MTFSNARLDNLLDTRRLIRLVTAVVLLVSASAGARAPADSRSSSQAKSFVLSELPADVAVYAVGTYRGTTDLPDIQLDASGHTVSQAEVVVNQPDRPVVLVLTAYDPTVWRVGRTPRTTIVGVILSGYHTQALIGIPKNTPQLASTYEKKGSFPFFYAHSASPELLAMNQAVKSLVGREIDRFIHKPTNGVFVVGNAPKDAKALVYSGDPVKGNSDPGRPLVGQKGLDRLVQEGKLRPATQADIDAWVDKESVKYKRFNPDLRVDPDMEVEHTYVVLKELTLPAGLYGAQARSFLIPEGVAFPKGPRGHNQFY